MGTFQDCTAPTTIVGWGRHQLRKCGSKSMLAHLLRLSAVEGGDTMNWNREPIPMAIAVNIGWNLPIDVVGSGVYGGIVKRDAAGSIVLGDEWPEDNRAPPAHNPVHSTGPYLDFSKFTPSNRGYSKIALMIQQSRGQAAGELDAMFQSMPDEDRKKLANL